MSEAYQMGLYQDGPLEVHSIQEVFLLRGAQGSVTPLLR